jgi:hypothetical protein
MDVSTLIAAFIGLVAPIVVSAFKWRASRIETRKARLDYWKAYFEVALLAGKSVGQETKGLCVAEFEEEEDEARNLGNKLVSSITTVFRHFGDVRRYSSLCDIFRVRRAAEIRAICTLQGAATPCGNNYAGAI